MTRLKERERRRKSGAEAAYLRVDHGARLCQCGLDNARVAVSCGRAASGVSEKKGGMEKNSSGVSKSRSLSLSVDPPFSLSLARTHTHIYTDTHTHKHTHTIHTHEYEQK